MSCNGLGKVVDDLTILESQGLDDRKHAFDETAALRTMTTEGAAPPQDGRPNGAFKLAFKGRARLFVRRSSSADDTTNLFTQDHAKRLFRCPRFSFSCQLAGIWSRHALKPTT
jgi:hypothetical protein